MDTQYAEWLAAVRQQGMNDEDIAQQLRSAGWTDQQITALLSPSTPVQPAPQEIPAAPPSAAPDPAPPTTLVAELPGPIAIFRATFASYATRFGYYLGYGVLAGLVTFAVTFAATWLVIFAFIDNALTGGLTSGSPITYIILFFALYLGVLLLNTLVATWLWSAIGLTVMTPDGQRRFFGILVAALKHVRHIFWANLIVGYVLSGFTILAIAIATFGTVASYALDMYDIPGYLFPILGVVLFFTTIAWIGTYLVYTPFAALLGNGRGLHAVRESQAIVHGMWWRTFGRLAAVLGPMVAITIIAYIILALLDINSIIPSLIIALLDVGLLLPIFITYTLGMYNTAANYRQQVLPVSRTSTTSMIIAASLGWVVVIGIFVWTFIGARSIMQPYYDDQFIDTSLYDAPEFDSDPIPFNGNTNASSNPDTIRSMDIFELQFAIEMYKAQEDRFPQNYAALLGTYIEEIPVDPVTNTPYSYTLTNGGENYNLCATLTSGEKQCVQSYTVTSNTNS